MASLAAAAADCVLRCGAAIRTQVCMQQHGSQYIYSSRYAALVVGVYRRSGAWPRAPYTHVLCYISLLCHVTTDQVKRPTTGLLGRSTLGTQADHFNLCCWVRCEHSSGVLGHLWVVMFYYYVVDIVTLLL
jgi:hypothetical protein